MWNFLEVQASQGCKSCNLCMTSGCEVEGRDGGGGGAESGALREVANGFLLQIADQSMVLLDGFQIADNVIGVGDCAVVIDLNGQHGAI